VCVVETENGNGGGAEAVRVVVSSGGVPRHVRRRIIIGGDDRG
jgi:hypothetical protein